MQEGMHVANLAFVLDYTDGTKKDEIEYDLLRLAFQSKGLVHYDRVNGANFEDIEQQPDSPVVMLLLVKDLIESVYRHNEEREFEPYIVVGYNDIVINRDDGFALQVFYRLLQDLEKAGNIERGF